MKKKSLNAKKIIHKNLLNNLKNPKILKIYNEFKKCLFNNFKQKKIAVAVSGGSDSLALSYFAKCFSILYKTEIKFYHVDHKLRKNSSKEALSLKLQLLQHDINCKILIWKGKKPKSNIQSIARTKRYDLIIKEIRKNKTNFILVGHHLDDLYENFLIRLSRGSGLKGLTSFSETKTKFNKNVVILRPLMKITKKDLKYVSKKVFGNFIDDDSNKNTNFKRIRIRNLINNLKNEGLDERKFNMTIRNLCDANSSINHYVNKNIKNNSRFLNNKLSYILNMNFFNQPHEIVFRSFSNVLNLVGQQYYPSRGKSINKILINIKLNNKIKKMTLSGCIIEKLNNSVLISRENK